MSTLVVSKRTRKDRGASPVAEEGSISGPVSAPATSIAAGGGGGASNAGSGGRSGSVMSHRTQKTVVSRDCRHLGDRRRRWRRRRWWRESSVGHPGGVLQPRRCLERVSARAQVSEMGFRWAIRTSFRPDPKGGEASPHRQKDADDKWKYRKTARPPSQDPRPLCRKVDAIARVPREQITIRVST